MNIGMILDNGFFGDVRVQNEVMALSKAGHEVFVLCFNFEDKKKFKKYFNSTIIYLRVPQLFKNKVKFISNSIFDFYSLFWAFHTVSFIKKYRIEVIHAHDLYMGRPVLLANKFFNLKTVIDLHENYPSAVISYSWAQSFLGKIFVSKERWLKREKKYLPKFSRIIVLSEDFKNELVGRIPELRLNNFILFPNYPDKDELLTYKVNTKIIEKNNDFIVFYFGGVAVRRGIFTLINALKKLIKTHKKIKLLIIGPVDKADTNLFYTQMNDSLIKENILYYEWKDISLFPSYLHISNVCVSPLIKNAQHESGIANKVFQYMLFGKPVIVSNCKPQQDVILKENSGLVFESENAEDLAEQILKLYNDESLCKKMGENGKRAVLAKYNLEKSSENLINNYELFNGSYKLL
jgi:glycosyltransferase involved in cell wall biosynthesis